MISHVMLKVIMSNLVNFIFSRSRPSLIPVAIVNTIAGIDYVILKLHKLEGVVIVRLDFFVTYALLPYVIIFQH